MPWPQLQQLGPSPPHSTPRPPSPAYLRAQQRSPPPFPCSVSAGPPSQKGILSLAPLERRHRSGSPEQPGVLPGAPRAVSGGPSPHRPSLCPPTTIAHHTYFATSSFRLDAEPARIECSHRAPHAALQAHP